LDITESEAKIESESVWGLLRGLESFSQSVYVAQNGKTVSKKNIFLS
jgi:hypothetical protein